MSSKWKIGKANRKFGLVKIGNNYNIPIDSVNVNLLDGIDNMNELINKSLTFQIEKKEKKKKQDDKRYKKSDLFKKRQAKKIKKLGKKKLGENKSSSE